jgi:hypothetical protein
MVRLFLLGICLSFLLSCNKSSTSADPSPTVNTTTGTDPVGTGADITKPLSELENPTDYTYTLAESKLIEFENNNLKTPVAGVTFANAIATISTAGTYQVKGNLSGHIIINVKNTETVRLILNGTSITSDKTSALYVAQAAKCILLLHEGSSNTFADPTTYTDISEGKNAAIFAKSYLAIDGKGSLNVKGNYNDGIGTNDGLVINSGTLNLTTKDDALRGKDYLVIRDADLTVVSGGDGMKSTNTTANYGYVLIDNGNYKIESQRDGISAENNVTIKNGTFNIKTYLGGTSTAPTDVSAKGIKANKEIVLNGTFTINSSDDAIRSDQNITIKGGTYTITTGDDIAHAENTLLIENATIKSDVCLEGLEAKFVTINDGKITILARNDCLNASTGGDQMRDDGSILTINGGTIRLSAQSGDPVDSNGSIVMNNGLLVVHGPANAPEVAIDINGAFTANGGTIMASGTNSNMTGSPGGASKINSVKIVFKTSKTAGNFLVITDSNNKLLGAIKPDRNAQSLVFASELLKVGSSYNVYSGGTITGTSETGYFSTGTYDSGTLVGSFNITAISNTANL